jgi:hypothetical protein
MSFLTQDPIKQKLKELQTLQNQLAKEQRVVNRKVTEIQNPPQEVELTTARLVFSAETDSIEITPPPKVLRAQRKVARNRFVAACFVLTLLLFIIIKMYV